MLTEEQKERIETLLKDTPDGRAYVRLPDSDGKNQVDYEVQIQTSVDGARSFTARWYGEAAVLREEDSWILSNG